MRDPQDDDASPPRALAPRRRALLAAGLGAVAVPSGFAWAQQPPQPQRPGGGPARPAAAADGRLAVVASFSILADLVREVGGERVSVRSIAGPDADAHTFQPRPSDAAAIRDAAVVVRNGLGFEPWMDRLVRSAGGRARVVTATEGVATVAAPEGGHSHGHGHGHGHSHGHAHGGGGGRRAAGAAPPPDPHAWQDVRAIPVYLRNIAEGLAAADPEGAGAYRRDAAAASGRMAALDAWVREQVATVPEARRVVLTSHDAFAYFGAAYGVRFVAPQGVSTEGEPSAAQVARLIRQVREEGISAVFVENMARPATLERLAREAGVRVRGRLYADALSGPGGPAPTYEAMVRHNVGLMVPAMRGEGA